MRALKYAICDKLLGKQNYMLDEFSSYRNVKVKLIGYLWGKLEKRTKQAVIKEYEKNILLQCLKVYAVLPAYT